MMEIVEATLLTFLLTSTLTVITFYLSTILVRKVIHLTHIKLTISHWNKEYKKQANTSGCFDVKEFNQRRNEAIRSVQEIGR